MTTQTRPKTPAIYAVCALLAVLLAVAGYMLYQEKTADKPIAAFNATANGETFSLEITKDGINTESAPAR